MATARDQLLSEALRLFKDPYRSESETIVQGLLDGFRIQAKSSFKLPENQTARESLGKAMTGIWKGAPANPSAHLRGLIDQFRMQTKNGSLASSPSSKPKTESSAKATKKAGRAASPKKTKGVQQPKKTSTVSLEPVAGGPQKRQGARSECPKCHSMGVVLARSYVGDEYYSCIYCGFQAYTKNVDQELDLPLAMELLGRRFDETDYLEETTEPQEETE